MQAERERIKITIRKEDGRKGGVNVHVHVSDSIRFGDKGGEGGRFQVCYPI